MTQDSLQNLYTVLFSISVKGEHQMTPATHTCNLLQVIGSIYSQRFDRDLAAPTLAFRQIPEAAMTHHSVE